MASPISFSFLILPLLLLCLASIVSAFDGLPFSYAGSHGPTHWGNLSSNFSACASGKMQSPINIIKNQTVLSKSLMPLIRNYHPTNLTLINNVCNVGLRCDGDGGVLYSDGINYTLKQMHWHSPSEHRIDGQRYDAELHIVHQTDSDSVAIVAILYRLGHADPFLAKIINKLTDLSHERRVNGTEPPIPCGVMSTKLLRKNTHHYYRYVGSFTVPPCGENVTWSILGKIRTISRDQLDHLRAPLDSAYKHNSRPCQSLNGRKVELYSGTL